VPEPIPVLPVPLPPPIGAFGFAAAGPPGAGAAGLTPGDVATGPVVAVGAVDGVGLDGVTVCAIAGNANDAPRSAASVIDRNMISSLMSRQETWPRRFGSWG
jgi:hypothetical protein